MCHCLPCVQVEGRGQGDPLLAALGSSLVQFGINVTSAAQENDDGQVFSVFKVTTKDGKQVPKVRTYPQVQFTIPVNFAHNLAFAGVALCMQNVRGQRRVVVIQATLTDGKQASKHALCCVGMRWFACWGWRVAWCGQVLSVVLLTSKDGK